MADAPDSGSGGVTPVGVQVPSFAPSIFGIVPPNVPPKDAFWGLWRLLACSAMTLPAVNPATPTCKVCGNVATRFAKVVLQDKDDERVIGEVDLCEVHFDKWNVGNGLSGR